MTQSTTSLEFNAPSSAAPTLHRAAIYTHPDDVASDPNLTPTEKRTILASWVSDARAVENAPALRRLDSGAVVEVDAILRVLTSLDDLSSTRRDDRKRPSPLPRRRSVLARWLGRGGRGLKKFRDDDDDPPFAPAGFGVPFRPTFVAADGARAATVRRLACVTA